MMKGFVKDSSNLLDSNRERVAFIIFFGGFNNKWRKLLRKIVT